MGGTSTSDIGGQAPGFYRFRVGAFTAVALHDGVLVRDRPPHFVRNADTDEVGEAFAACGMARDKLTQTFHALAVETRDGVVLIDTGMGAGAGPAAGRLPASLAAAGIDAAAVSSVIISHFHGDHIGGLRGPDGTAAFPNAEVLVPEVEWDVWLGDAAHLPDALKGTAASAHRAFDPIAADVRRYAFGEELLPGFTPWTRAGTRPAWPPSRSRRWTRRRCSSPTSPTTRSSSPGIRSGRPCSTWTWKRPLRRGGACSTALPPTIFACRSSTPPSRRRATSSRAAAGTTTSRRCGRRPDPIARPAMPHPFPPGRERGSGARPGRPGPVAADLCAVLRFEEQETRQRQQRDDGGEQEGLVEARGRQRLAVAAEPGQHRGGHRHAEADAELLEHASDAGGPAQLRGG
ncbi:MBL fold metallo-hydrolase [Lichenibacterium minor]|uniref:MBL fold metallo-hydrolase n=1 Tax=Lichenibacterium minor TaxID=2316528 RepID=A0A4Q2TYL7_9HYPH|nr:MBL fold metallo-hydrolase [Lichenibacterium minor]